MRNTVRGVGTAGLIRDVKPQLIPSQFWTDGRNIRFENQKVKNMGGVLAARTKTGVLSSGLVVSPTQSFLLYTTGGKAYAWDGSTEADITRTVGGDYSETADALFDISSFNGFGLLHNGVDIPQLWDPSLISNPLVPLTNWNTNWVAKVLKPFKSFLIALNMVESGNEYPHKMRWSHPAEAGAVPSSWDETDPTKEAGEFSFADTDRGSLVNGLEMGNEFYVYKEGSIWVLRYVGGSQILSRDPVADYVGLRVKRSLVNMPFTKSGGPAQFFAADDNFYMMNGFKVFSVFENVYRNEILKLADPDNYASRSFALINYRHQELWFCIPEVGEDYATLAFCFNFQNETYSIRELSGASTITSRFGRTFSSGSAQQDLPFSDNTKFSDNTGFLNIEVLPTVPVILETSPANNQMFYLDTGDLDYDGVSDYPAWVMRQSLPTIKNDSRNPEATIVDYNSRSLVTSIIPKLYDGSLLLDIGVQETENSAISWLGDIVLDTSTFKQDLSSPISGRFLSFKFSRLGSQVLELGGFDYEVDVLGMF